MLMLWLSGHHSQSTTTTGNNRRTEPTQTRGEMWQGIILQPSSSSQQQLSLRQQGPPSSSRLTLPPQTGGGGGGSLNNNNNTFNCTLAGLVTDGSDLGEGNCSTTASPRHHHHHHTPHATLSSSMSLHPSSSACISNSPFSVSPAASSEGGGGGAPSVRLTGNLYLGGGGGGFPSGFLPCAQAPSSDGRDRDSSGIKEEYNAATGAYFSADTLDAREFAQDFHAARSGLDTLDFGRASAPQIDAPDFSVHGSSLNQMNSLFFNASSQQIPNNNQFGQQVPLPSLMMISPGHPFLQEQRASNENTPLGSPRIHDGPGWKKEKAHTLMGIVFSSFSCSSSWTLSMPLMGMIFPWCSCCSSWTLSYAPHIKIIEGFFITLSCTQP